MSNNYHPRTMSEGHFHTLSHASAAHDRRYSADDEDERARAGSSGSRPIPLPRRNQSSPSNQLLHGDPGRGDQEGRGAIHSLYVTTTSQQPPSQHSEIQRPQAQVEDLRREEKVIAMMKEREEAVRQRELDLAARERELSLKESHMESEYSDKNFQLSQKRRDLQLLEDQLHMKNKDLKHKEFDLMNADSPADVSSSQMADLADRTFELDKREEELGRKQKSLENWAHKLSVEDQDLKRRLYDLQQREAYLESPAHVAHPNPSGRPYTTQYQPQHQPWNPELQEQQQQQHQQHQQHNFDRVPEAYPAGNQQWSTRVPGTFSPLAAGGVPSNWPPEVREEPPFRREMTDAIDIPRNTQHQHFVEQPPMLPPSPPQEEPITMMGHEPPEGNQLDRDMELARQLMITMMGHEPPEGNQLDRDMELARQLMEEEEKKEEERRRMRIATDQLLALTLQQEDLTGTDDLLTHTNQLGGEEDSEGAAGVIKRELDTRLSQEQMRKKREREDYIFAQNLVDEKNNSESNE